MTFHYIPTASRNAWPRPNLSSRKNPNLLPFRISTQRNVPWFRSVEPPSSVNLLINIFLRRTSRHNAECWRGGSGLISGVCRSPWRQSASTIALQSVRSNCYRGSLSQFSNTKFERWVVSPISIKTRGVPHFTEVVSWNLSISTVKNVTNWGPVCILWGYLRLGPGMSQSPAGVTKKRQYQEFRRSRW